MADLSARDLTTLTRSLRRQLQQQKSLLENLTHYVVELNAVRGFQARRSRKDPPFLVKYVRSTPAGTDVHRISQRLAACKSEADFAAVAPSQDERFIIEAAVRAVVGPSHFGGGRPGTHQRDDSARPSAPRGVDSDAQPTASNGNGADLRSQPRHPLVSGQSTAAVATALAQRRQRTPGAKKRKVGGRSSSRAASSKKNKRGPRKKQRPKAPAKA